MIKYTFLQHVVVVINMSGGTPLRKSTVLVRVTLLNCLGPKLSLGAAAGRGDFSLSHVEATGRTRSSWDSKVTLSW